jgi:hypothetical protein
MAGSAVPRWGLPGVHGFYAGNDWELFRQVRPGDRVMAIERVVGVEEKESKFSGRLVLQYVEATYSNQNGDLIARVGHLYPARAQGGVRCRQVQGHHDPPVYAR